jgi:cobalamin biosynthesis Mg chelatase CobN
MDMITTMLQAEKRGYWSTDQENIDNLKKLYLDLESWVEKKFDH